MIGDGVASGVLTYNTCPELGEPSCGSGLVAGADITFEWTAPTTGTYRISTSDPTGSAFEANVYVLDGSCAGAELACADSVDGVTSVVFVALAAGQTVVIVLDTVDAFASGTYTLNIHSR
jgi:hypothetical protein